jgi:hypothetical protein
LHSDFLRFLMVAWFWTFGLWESLIMPSKGNL